MRVATAASPPSEPAKRATEEEQKPKQIVCKFAVAEKPVLADCADLTAVPPSNPLSTPIQTSRYHKKSKHRYEWKLWKNIISTHPICVTVYDDDELLLCQDGFVSLYQLPKKEPLWTRFIGTLILECVMDQRFIAVRDAKYVYVWERGPNPAMYVHGISEGEITTMAIHSSPATLVYGTTDGFAVRVHPITGIVEYAKEPETYSPVRSISRTVVCFDNSIATETVSIERVKCIAHLVVNDTYLITMDEDWKVVLFDLNSMKRGIALLQMPKKRRCRYYYSMHLLQCCIARNGCNVSKWKYIREKECNEVKKHVANQGATCNYLCK